MEDTTKRISWDQYFMEIATLAKQRSTCGRLNVGCVIVKNNRIISTGYNGNLPGASHRQIMKDNHDVSKIHAEMNSICDAASRGVSIQDSTIYVTHYPCLICAKLIGAAGIKKVIYKDDYRNDPLVKEIFDEVEIEIVKI